MNKNKGIIGIGVILAIVLGVVIIGGGAYYLGKGSSKQEVKIEETQSLENQNDISKTSIQNSKTSDVIKNSDQSSSTSCVDQPMGTAQVEGMPVITSLSTYFGSIGDVIEINGCNFSGFEGDKIATIKNSQGVTANIAGELGSTAKLLKIKLKSPLCQQDNSYSGKPCTSWLTLTPGVYKIYTMPWGKKSNEITFTINSANIIPTANIKLLSFKANNGEFLAETGRLINISNVEIKVYYFPTGTGITEPSLLGSMIPYTGSSGSIQTWSLPAYLDPYTKNKQALMATSIYATLYLDGKKVNTINYPVTGAGAINDSLYGNQ